jgi:molybdopterin-binding protein
VKKITEGPINAEVVVELPGGQEIVAVITEASAKRLSLGAGRDVFAVIKASSVILGVE